MTAPQDLQRPPAEVRFADELAKLGAADSAPRPPGRALNRTAARRCVALTLQKGTVAGVPGVPGQEQTVVGVFRSTGQVGYLKEASTPMSATHPAFPADPTALVSGGAK